MRHLVIIGAGAAGLFAAGTALVLGHRVTLVEHMDSPGKKLAITGKGRCNLTNACDEAEFLKNIRHNPRFLYSSLYALPPFALMDFFEQRLGLPLKTERGRRVFPQSDRAQDVVEALRRYAAGAELVRGRAQKLLLDASGKVTGVALADGKELLADAVLVATGGLSYPVVGATGDGYRLAEQVGHSIVSPVPSLVAMVCAPPQSGEMTGGNPGEAAAGAGQGTGFYRLLAGLALRNVRLCLLQDGKAVYNEQGELLFTHFGVSGPLALSASAYLGDLEKHKYVLQLDLKPALAPEQLDARILRDFEEMANRDAAHALDKLLPQSLRPVMLELWGVDPAQKVNQLTRTQRQKLVALLKDLRLPVTGRGDLDHAVITAGGVDVREVDPKTMQSKLAPGLFFAGEVLDVDGYTGGYNLHIAWCTAYAAAGGMGA